MKGRLDKAWEAAAKLGIPVPVGDIVVCDMCGEDFTDSDAVGGMILGSKAYCPACSARAYREVTPYDIERAGFFAHAKPLETFKAFVLRISGPDRTIYIGPHEEKTDADHD